MKNTILIAMLVCVLTGIYSCSTPTHVEKDASANLSNYKTYMWVDVMANENDASGRATSFADLSVHNAVNEELSRWGWRKAVLEKPDVLISYDILVEKNVETQSDPLYSQPYSRFYYNRFSKRWSTIYYPSEFLGYQQYHVPVKEAAITITIVDAGTDTKVWQGWSTERLSGAGITDLNVKKAVRNIFKESANVTSR